MRHARASTPSILEDLASWRKVLEGDANTVEELLSLAASTNPREVRELARLKAKYDDGLVRVALEVIAARRKAEGRLEDAATLLADTAGVEQASRSTVANYKAARFKAAGAKRVLDVCCGMGADARGLARAGLETIGIDQLEARTLMTARYAGCAVETKDVADRKVTGEWIHLDPSRREEEKSGGSARRSVSLDEMRPGFPVIDRLMNEASVIALKLGPGVDGRALPWRDQGELDFVSDDGQLVQAIFWKGESIAKPGARRATLLPSGVTFVSDKVAPPMPGPGGPLRYVYTVDPALERSQIVGALAATLGVPIFELFPGLGLLTSQEPVESPWLTRFRLVEFLPWRPDRIRDWLRAHDGGVVEVKTRGGAIDALAIQKELRGEGSTTYTLFGLRFGKKIVAIVAHRE